MSKPPADDRDHGLVEPEGVDTASADTTAEGEEPRHGDVRAGGHPEQAPPPGTAPRWQVPDDGAMAGAPGTEAPDPGQEAAPPAQDSGSSDG